MLISPLALPRLIGRLFVFSSLRYRPVQDDLLATNPLTVPEKVMNPPLDPGLGPISIT